jgi:exonuclease III
MVLSNLVLGKTGCAPPAQPEPKRSWRLNSVKKWSFVNAQGLNDDKLLELSKGLKTGSFYGAMVAETHRVGGHEELELSEGYLFVGFGGKERGCRGVGFVLSRRAQKDWCAEGRKVLYESERIMMLRMAGADAPLTVGTAYFPHTGYTEPCMDEFYDEFESALSARTADVLIGADVNADIGRQRNRSLNRAAAVGPHGLRKWNERGDRVVDWAVSRGLMMARTFFEKKWSLIPTWFEFGGEKAPHSLDQFIVSKSLFPTVVDAARSSHLVHSDHNPITIKLRATKRSWSSSRAAAAEKPIMRDFGALQGPHADAIARRMKFRAEFVTVHAAEAAELKSTPYGAFASALDKVVESCVPEKDRPRPGWFTKDCDTILEAAEARNKAQTEVNSLKVRGVGGAAMDKARDKLKAARDFVASTVVKAKNEWIHVRCSELNGADGCGGGNVYWKAAKELMGGLEKPAPSKTIRLKKADGNLATSDKENLAVLEPHFERLYNRASTFDPDVLEKLVGRALILELDEFPSDAAIKGAISKLQAGKSGGNGQPSDALKLVGSTPEGFEIIKGFFRDFWDSELAPAAWVTLQLAVLPKKGDLSDPNNLRGIALMEAAPKLAGIIIASLLNEHVVLPDEDFAYQCGFVPDRGCPDGQMPIKLALQKRHQADLDSYVLFVDLVKAFDSVDRVALDGVLEKLGVPAKLRNLIMALHSNVKLDIKFGDDVASILNTMGVVQGGTLSPTLFIIFVHAFVLTLDTSDWELPNFSTAEDDKLGMRDMNQLLRDKNKGTSFKLPFSFYADDSGFIFCSRRDSEVGAAKIRIHYQRWGLEMHVGRGGKVSKTVALFCPGCSRSYEDGDTSAIVFDDDACVTFVESFKYLGSYIHHSLKDDFDVDQRISAASKIFGMLRENVFSHKKVSYRAKRAAYTAIVLSTLLYGSETWTLSAKALQKLRSFHNRCARAMVHISMWHTREHHIRTEDVLRRLELESLDTYLLRRVARWLGHVARLPFDRLPRKFLSAWIPLPRPRSTPRLHFGTHMRNTLKRINVAPDKWYAKAQDKDKWRETVNTFHL